MRLPRHLLGPALLPILPHAASTILTPLPPLAMVCHHVFLRRIRLRHIDSPATGEIAGGRGCSCFGHLVVCLFLAVDLCFALDEGQV